MTLHLSWNKKARAVFIAESVRSIKTRENEEEEMFGCFVDFEEKKKNVICFREAARDSEFICSNGVMK